MFDIRDYCFGCKYRSFTNIDTSIALCSKYLVTLRVEVWRDQRGERQVVHRHPVCTEGMDDK